PKTFLLDLAVAAIKKGVGVVIDSPAANLAPTLRKLKGARKQERLVLLKPNLTELEELTGQHFHEVDEIAAAARILTEKSALACVSLGSEGALLVSRNRVWAGRAPEVHAVGSVGAGDSMVGAMCWALAERGLLTPEKVDQADTETLADVFRW